MFGVRVYVFPNGINQMAWIKFTKVKNLVDRNWDEQFETLSHHYCDPPPPPPLQSYTYFNCRFTKTFWHQGSSHKAYLISNRYKNGSNWINLISHRRLKSHSSKPVWGFNPFIELQKEKRKKEKVKYEFLLMPHLSPPTSKRLGSQFESMNLAIILHIVVQSVALRNRLALRRLDRGC